MGTKTRLATERISAALFGAAKQAVLRLLFEHADERFYQRQIVRELGVGSGAVQRELRRLADCGILVRSVEGRQTYYQANRDSPVFDDLRGLIRKTFGIAGVLQTSLATLGRRIRLAFVYGSIASHAEGAGSDVDVMVVGDHIGLAETVSALRTAQHELRREVNPTVYRTDEFRRKLVAGQHFVSSVVAGPKIFLIGDERELARLAKGRLAEAASDEPTRDRRAVPAG